MYLKELEITGFKSFAKKYTLKFNSPISAIVGPNGSGKSNIAEAFRFVLGEQSFKSMRGKRGEDLIFNGAGSVVKQPKATVRVTFDNSSKVLPVDYDDVILERVVHCDGVNEYKINDSVVRLKDITEMLAAVNIGSSGHHIISQGEADRILNASPKERKIMLEDALGLKLFQYKKNESERKLAKTDENIKQVQSLRKEIAPHINFLQRQVKKIEQGKEMKKDLLGFYKEYLRAESIYLKNKRIELTESIDQPQKRLNQINEQIAKAENIAKEQVQNELINQIKDLENQISLITPQKENLLKEEGRVDGQIFSLQKLIQKKSQVETTISVDLKELASLKGEINNFEEESITINNVESLRKVFSNLLRSVRNFLENKTIEVGQDPELMKDLHQNQQKIKGISESLKRISSKEIELQKNINDLRQKLDEDKSSSLSAEKEIIRLMSEKNQIQQGISRQAISFDTLNRDEEAFKQEITEAAILVGREVLEYENLEGVKFPKNREEQIDNRKKLERMKIKVEDIGANSGQEIIEEYKEVSERDTFLVAEIEDLEKTAESLRELILDLSKKIENQFHIGVLKINKEFQDFFELMFGGGSASIKVTKMLKKIHKDTDLDILGDEYPEEEESEEGIDIKVSLPRKKISGLMMLSGGERALTSIALLFAISQVNPPPFVILDETDAALDEANSRKYGDMIENLSKNSQLILITHNRETMSRAGVLYGITMNNGISQLLSVAFDEGAKWAK